MGRIDVRDARSDEARLIVQMTRRMVADMECYGGYAAATAESAWDKLTAFVADEIKKDNFKYVVAEAAAGDPVGAAGAELIALGGAFAPRKVLHLSVVYVLPQFRRTGIACTLLARILDWGRAAGAEQCDLNVLCGNPARLLYERLGFSAFEIKMIRSL